MLPTADFQNPTFQSQRFGAGCKFWRAPDAEHPDLSDWVAGAAWTSVVSVLPKHLRNVECQDSSADRSGETACSRRLVTRRTPKGSTSWQSPWSTV